MHFHRTRGVFCQHPYHTAHGGTSDEPRSKTAFTHGPGCDTKGAAAGESKPTLDARCADSHGTAVLGQCDAYRRRTGKRAREARVLFCKPTYGDGRERTRRSDDRFQECTTAAVERSPSGEYVRAGLDGRTSPLDSRKRAKLTTSFFSFGSVPTVISSTGRIRICRDRTR